MHGEYGLAAVSACIIRCELSNLCLGQNSPAFLQVWNLQWIMGVVHPKQTRADEGGSISPLRNQWLSLKVLPMNRFVNVDAIPSMWEVRVVGSDHPFLNHHGIIGLQIHSGPPTEAWYRNIRLRDLSSK